MIFFFYTLRETYAAECHEKDDQIRGVTKKVKNATRNTLQPLSKMGDSESLHGAKNTQQALISIGSGTSYGKDQGSNIGKDHEKHPKFSQFELIKKCFGPQDHDHVICFGHGVTPKDVRGPQPSKADLMAEIQQKNEQINSLTDRVDALELNHQKKIEEMKTAHEVHMAEMKESHQ
ncbi:hypothetical protein Cgig2_024062 [Carnegiea gigantea]|uniref:Uncharacterized protein n=1 Tax=Carnegiea gigantea TaxID=171969 RepID=A0A9Q1KKJ1_9CARY|nr:hypothetical protein Cgig2_024062 [Carnegiea gigantea]